MTIRQAAILATNDNVRIDTRCHSESIATRALGNAIRNHTADTIRWAVRDAVLDEIEFFTEIAFRDAIRKATT